MKHTRLGATGLKVSRLGFGTMTLGKPVDERTSMDVLDCAVGHGVNVIDTANTYNAGLSEQIIGRWMRSRGNRDRIVLASKVRYQVGDDPQTAGLSPKVIVRELERSLERLGTDYLDIYYLHQPDDDTPIEVTLRCLDDLVASGRVRCLGLSNYAAWQVAQAFDAAMYRGWARPLVVQYMHNLVARAVEQELLPMARAFDIGQCAYNPLAGGLLTGKYGSTDEAPAGTRFADSGMYRRRYWHERQREAAARLCEVARAGGRTPVELALRFLLDRGDANTVLLGATRVEQLEQSLAAMEAAPLDARERNACDAVWASLHGPVPRYQRVNADAAELVRAPEPAPADRRSGDSTEENSTT